MLTGKPKSWVGKLFRNIHTDKIYKVSSVYLWGVEHFDIDKPGQYATTHYSTFRKHFVLIEEER